MIVRILCDVLLMGLSCVDVDQGLAGSVEHLEAARRLFASCAKVAEPR